MFSYLIVLALLASEKVFTAVNIDSTNFTSHESDHQEIVLQRFKRQNSVGSCKLSPHPSVTYWCRATVVSGPALRECKGEVPTGTQVYAECNAYYTNVNETLRHMYCIDGTWDHVTICKPECGIVTPKGKPLATSGGNVRRGELPWHVGIYKRLTPYRQICGGTLITTNIVISAARCFWHYNTHKQPASYYIVGFGKLERSWDAWDTEHTSDITEIKLAPGFRGEKTHFRDDIALVKLATPAVLDYYIRPVCTDFDVEFDEQQLQPGNIGKVASWGEPVQNASQAQLLKAVELPYVSVEQCINDTYPVDLRLFITSDKICAGTKTDITLCSTDTGTGLVFPRVEKKSTRWYLRGIASLPTYTVSSGAPYCSKVRSFGFTKLLNHSEFVRSYLRSDSADKEAVDHLTKTDCAVGSSELCNTTSTTNESKCVLPSYPEHGSYTVLERTEARPGQALQFATLTVTCRLPYRPDGAIIVNCHKGHWYSDMPECKRFCQLTPHPSVKYFCKPTDPKVSGSRECNEFEPSGTEVNPQCNEHYTYKGVLEFMYCNDGSWNKEVICEPECGTLAPKGATLIINGTSAKRGELPWHAGIYDKRFTPYMQICGGSLASTTVVISAAHCFWNDVENLVPAKHFAVEIGKLYRPWNIEKEGQRSDVKDIKVPPRFLGTWNNYQDDIALVILETPVVLGHFVRPVCIDFSKALDRRQLRPGNVGKVAGWGLTSEDGDASGVLKVTDLPYVDVEECIADLPFDFRSYITSDKICAGTKTGTALCHGDSGGGLVFSAEEWRIQRWYLRGVVSTAPSNGHKCNANSYTSFTQLLKHDDFVRKYLHNQ